MDALKRLMEIKKRKAELMAELRTLSGEDLDKAITEVDTLTKEEDDLNKRIKDAEDVEKRGRALVTPVKEEKPAEKREAGIDSEEYRSAYLKNLQGKELTSEERATLTTAANSVGAVVPTITLNKIIEKLEQAGVVLPLVTRLAIPSNVTIPVEDTTNDVSWVAEGTESTPSADKIGKISLAAHELIKTIEITAHVEAMSIDAFEGFIVAQLSKKAKIAIDNAIVNGDGSNKATGILTSLSGTAQAIETTANTGYTYDDIMDILKALKSGYKQGAKFMMSTTTLYGEIAKIKDDEKRPIFKMETDGRFEGKLLGYPVVVYDGVPENKVLFGNFDYYFFNFVKAFEIAKDTSVGFKAGKTCYRAMALCDGKLALAEAFVVMSKKS